MELSVPTLKRRYGILRLIMISTLLGFFYPLLAGEWNDMRAMINGMLIGFFGGIVVSVFEFKIFDPHSRKLSFLTVLSLKTLFYFIAFIIIILGVKGFIDSLYAGKNFWAYLNGAEFKYFINEEDFDIILTYTFLILVMITFTIQMGRKIGYNTLLQMITGKYFLPREEERIFMLIDIKSSTSIAEKFEKLKYHQFLNDFYHDITKSILYAKGDIYRYVGDEIMISWRIKKDFQNLDYLSAYFYANQEIFRHREKYMDKYGIIPEFTTCFHAGKIIVGEIGEVKSQVVFSGEPLTELQKLKKSAILLQKNLIISETLINRLRIPSSFRLKDLGMLETDGQTHNLKIFTLEIIGN